MRLTTFLENISQNPLKIPLEKVIVITHGNQINTNLEILCNFLNQLKYNSSKTNKKFYPKLLWYFLNKILPTNINTNRHVYFIEPLLRKERETCKACSLFGHDGA